MGSFKQAILSTIKMVDHPDDQIELKQLSSTSTSSSLPPKPRYDPFINDASAVFTAAIDFKKDKLINARDKCEPNSYELCHLPEIYHGLYLGNAEAAWDGTILKNSNIKAVLNVTRDQKLAPGMLGDQIEHYKQICIEDTMDAKLFEMDLKRAMLFLDRCYLKGVNVLVHCRAGKSRSVSIVMAWAIGRFHKTLIDLLPLLYKRRNGLNVNDGFQLKLQSLEKFIHRENTVERGAGKRRSKGGKNPIITMFNSGGASRF